jgi:hypothetical protein
VPPQPFPLLPAPLLLILACNNLVPTRTCRNLRECSLVATLSVATLSVPLRGERAVACNSLTVTEAISDASSAWVSTLTRGFAAVPVTEGLRFAPAVLLSSARVSGTRGYAAVPVTEVGSSRE